MRYHLKNLLLVGVFAISMVFSAGVFAAECQARSNDPLVYNPSSKQISSSWFWSCQKGQQVDLTQNHAYDYDKCAGQRTYNYQVRGANALAGCSVYNNSTGTMNGYQWTIYCSGGSTPKATPTILSCE